MADLGYIPSVAEEIPKPSQLPDIVPASPGAMVASDEEMDRACSDLGLVRFRPKTIKALKIIGKSLPPEEMAQVQSAQIILTQERLAKLLDKCQEIVDNAEMDETAVDAIRAATAICAETNKACDLVVKMLSEKMLRTEAANQRKFAGFKPGDVVIPLQINVGREKPEEKESAPAE